MQAYQDTEESQAATTRKLLSKGWLNMKSNFMFANYIVEDLQNFITMPLGRPIGGLNDFPYGEFWFVSFWILIHVCLCFVLFVCLWVWVEILQCVHGGQRADKIGYQSPPSTLSQPFVGQPCTKQARSQTPCEHPACFLSYHKRLGLHTPAWLTRVLRLLTEVLMLVWQRSSLNHLHIPFLVSSF